MTRFTLALLMGFAISAQALPADSVYNLNDTFTDHAGQDFKLESRKGRVHIVSMFYSTCRFACPLIVNSMDRIVKALPEAERGEVDLMLVTFDPERDTVDVLAKLAKDRRLNLDHWTLARGEPDTVRKLAAVFEIRYRQRDDMEFDHSNVLVLLDADGLIKARTSEIGAKPDAEFVAKVREEIARAKSAATPAAKKAP